ncbi:MAG: YbjN domain-containing protein [Deinococcales bacterium]
MQAIEKTINHAQLSDVLQRLSLVFEFPKADLCVVQLDESTNMLIIFYGQDSEASGEGSSLKFRSAWGNAKNLSHKAINAFNRKFRFVKAYLDLEGDPILEMDLLVEGSSTTYMQNSIRKFIELVTTFETFMALAEDFQMNLD